MAHGATRAGALAFMAGVLALCAGAASAQPARTLSQVERDRSAQASRAERLRAQAEAARNEVAALDRRLVQSSRRRAEAEAAATDAELRLAALRLRMDAEGARYQHGRDAFEAALIAAAFAERRIEHTATRAGIFARAAAPALREVVRASAQALADARALDIAIAEEQRTLSAAQTDIDEERAELLTLLTRRRAVQATLVADATTAERRVRQLAAEARTLRELAERVQAATRRSGPATNGASVIPAAWLAPAAGALVHAYGERVAGGPAAQGATLRTRTGAQVVAPAGGEVAYAGAFRGYGQVLILNLDGGYALVLTGLDAVRARVGERVRAGQTIGEMPISDTPAPELYVEVRRDGQPIDPARWLSARGVQAGAAASRSR